MSTCRHCGQRKGKRTCPALEGMICSKCCGQHRLGEIACPPSCVHLGGLAVASGLVDAVPFTKAEYTTAWAKLQAFGFESPAWEHEMRTRPGKATRWDPTIAVAYTLHGHRDGEGRRLIDRFLVVSVLTRIRVNRSEV